MCFWAKIDFTLKFKSKTNKYIYFLFFIHFFIFFKLFKNFFQLF